MSRWRTLRYWISGSARRAEDEDIQEELEALRQFAPFSNRPIFSVHATMLGYGRTGGRLLDYADVGREAGRAREADGTAAGARAPVRRNSRVSAGRSSAGVASASSARTRLTTSATRT